MPFRSFFPLPRFQVLLSRFLRIFVGRPLPDQVSLPFFLCHAPFFPGDMKTRGFLPPLYCSLNSNISPPPLRPLFSPTIFFFASRSS